MEIIKLGIELKILILWPSGVELGPETLLAVPAFT